jgi:phenylalanyl-tRNA synthetase beta chain
MNVPMRWLSEFVQTGLAAADLAQKLTMAGLEAEKITTIGGGWENVYVGEVKKVERHPDADRLVLANVDARDHRLTVVTGAPNIREGQKVALALAGARLIDGYSETLQYKTLKPGTIRGVRSEGMVCSEKELGLSNEHEGILVLSPEATVGATLQEWLGDTVIEFEITPNLVHAFSIAGIAREAAAITDCPLHLPPAADLAALPEGDKQLVRIEALDLCPRYMGIVIEGITVGPSPEWMSQRLIAAGLRPVNNIVDVTNYVMLEVGQPLHAFDRSHLHEGRIVVRRAKPGETIETLDHQVRELSPEMLVIADADRPVAVAGVMGGVDSEIDEGTSTLLLEGANFDMVSVRHTRTALKLRTDASARFERGLDPNLVGQAMARATHLLLELCPDSRVAAVRDVYPSPVEPSALSLPFDRIERVLGIRYEPEVVLDVLTRLGFQRTLNDGTLTVIVPTYRRDVSIPEDIIEEVARIVGYETLPSRLPSGELSDIVRDPLFRLKEQIRSVLTGAGASEAVTYSTVGEIDLVGFDQSDKAGFLYEAPVGELVRLVNPIQAERPYLRSTLIPSLLSVVAENMKHEQTVELFELARVYLPQGEDTLPKEIELAGIVIAGDRAPLSRFTTPGELDYFDLKGMIEAVGVACNVTNMQYETASHPALHPGRAAAISVGDTRLGLIGELRPDVAAAHGLNGVRVIVTEIDLPALLRAMPPRYPDVSVPRFLPVEQDFAIVVDEAVPAQQVEAALRAGAGPLVTSVTLFDIFRGAQIGEGKKSLAYRVTFTAPNRALTDAELVKARGKLERTLRQQAGGTLRT